MIFRSMVCHALLTVALLAGSYFERQGALWGGVGGQPGGTKVNLVSSAGIPMPKEEMVTESKTADPTFRRDTLRRRELLLQACPRLAKEARILPVGIRGMWMRSATGFSNLGIRPPLTRLPAQLTGPTRQ